MDWIYLANMGATAAFAASGIVAVRGVRIDIFGAMVVAVVTAVGGGTVRDLLLDTPIFWLHDSTWLWVATLTGLTAFACRSHISSHGTLLDYLDAMGVALFASGALVKSLALGLPIAHAVAMGVITGIGGGLLRDILTGRETLLVSPELYATPIILGLTLQSILGYFGMLPDDWGVAVGAGMIFLTRAIAIHWHLRMPALLINRPD